MEYIDVHGNSADFECEHTIASHWVSRDILAGHTYPDLDFVPDVRTIVDVGANCGAASVYFAQRHPDAVVHAVEPGARQRAILERNTARFDKVRVHPIGLDDKDHEAALYFGDDDSGKSSIIRGAWNTEEHEIVTLRNATSWAREQGITSIDILKVDVEGLEVEVLTSFGPLLATAKVVYLEYDSRSARRTIATMLETTHELFIAKQFLDQGEITYLHGALAEQPAAREWFSPISLA
jgi:FkbM family methyltransferase